MRQLPLKIFHILAPALAVGVLMIDLSMGIFADNPSQLSISFIFFSAYCLRTLLIIAMLAGWGLLLYRKYNQANLSLNQKLWRLTLILGLNYLVALLIQIIFTDDPPASLGGPIRPEQALQVHSIGILAVISLGLMYMIVLHLVLYRQRHTTRRYLRLFWLLTLVSTVFAYINQEPIQLNANGMSGNFQETVNTLLVIGFLILSFIIALRNDWITYLPRKQKYLFFGVGIVVIAQILLLNDFVYQPHVRHYSLIVANLSNIIWFFMVVYSLFALATLAMHLPTARAVDRKLREVNSLQHFASTLNSELDRYKLTQLITQLSSKVLESNAAWLLLHDTKRNQFRLASQDNLSETERQAANHRELFAEMGERIAKNRRSLMINDVQQDQRSGLLRDWKNDARSLIAAPLLSSRNQLLGIIFACKSQPFGFDADNLSLLESFANQSAIALENAELWQASLEKERLEQELKIAREVQLKLVPQRMPEIPGYELEAYFLTAYEVGGDYYDFYRFADAAHGLVIGDVSGKGTSAAFYMAEFKGVMQSLCSIHSDPKTLTSQANRILYNSLDRQTFVTAIVGHLDTRRNVFSFVRAGHTPILYCSAESQEAVLLQPEGLGIGLTPDDLFQNTLAIKQLQLAKDDTIILFTDGLVEARNPAGEEYGEERLRRLLSQRRSQSIADLKDAILSDITSFVDGTPLHDDLTFIIARYVGK